MKYQTKILIASGIFLLGAVIFGTVLAVKMGGSRDKKTEDKPESRVVKLFRVQGDAGIPSISYPGKIQPVRHASLFFRVSGPVIEQNLKLGQPISSGDVLMRIDPRDYERDVERITHELEMRQVENKLLETEFKRMKKLLEGNATSQANFDSALTKKQSSDAQIKMLETSLKTANDRLSDTVLRAPFDSVVTEIKIERYEMAQAYVSVVTLQSLRDLEIRVNIPEGNIPTIGLDDGKQYKGQKFNVTFPGRGDRQFIATLEEFKLNAAAESGTYEVRLRMEQPKDFILLPGMTAEVHGLPHMLRMAPKSFRIPYAALFQRDQSACVWIYNPENSRIHLRKVVPGKTVDGNFISIGQGIRHGEYLVAAGGDWLTEGLRVDVLNPEVLHASH